MWSPLALRPPRSVAPARTSSGHQSARFGGTCTPTPGSRRRASCTSRTMSSTVTGAAHRAGGPPPGRLAPGRGGNARAPVVLGRGGGDLGRLLAVVAAVRDVVL